MKKLIIKTCILTLIIILAVGFSIFGIVSVTSPSIIANTAFNLGAKNTCVTYTIKQYEKSKDVKDLLLLVKRSAWAKDYSSTSKYAPLLLSDEGFYDYLVSDPTLENYVASLLVESLYKTNNIEKFIDVAFSYYKGNSGPNTLRVAIVTAKDDTETLAVILKKLRAIENKTEETNNLIEQINQRINK